MLQWWAYAGPEWIVQRLGVVWRESADDPVVSVPVAAVLIEGDCTSEEGLTERAHTLAESNRMPSPANLWICDPPFGYNKHEGTDDEGSEWDSEAWSGEELVRCLKANMAAGFLSEDNIGMIYHRPDKIGEYWAALKEAGFKHPQLVYFYKAGQDRCVEICLPQPRPERLWARSFVCVFWIMFTLAQH
jgi:hypothetical protein